MRVVVAVDTRLSRTPDGAVWTRSGPSYRFWTRYLTVFDEVRVVARVAEVAKPPDGATRVDGPSVEVRPLPYYLGPLQYLRRRPALGRAVRDAVGPDDAVVLRVPSAAGWLMAWVLRARGQRYALEVISDPYDVFAPGAVRHPLRPVLRAWFPSRLRAECRRASAVAYVTRYHLQRRYPPAPEIPTAWYSSIELAPEAFLPGTGRPAGREPGPAPGEPTLISVGSLAQPYKGVDILISAVGLLAEAGRPVRLVHLGDGRYRGWLEGITDRLGLTDRVSFLGEVPAGERVRRLLDAADLFVMPSRTEGLPRALIEAMARGLPAIGTTVGGIPELLPERVLVPPEDPRALADRIGRLLDDPDELARCSRENLTRARDYRNDVLAPRRTAFYRAVRDAVAGGLLERRGV